MSRTSHIVKSDRGEASVNSAWVAVCIVAFMAGILVGGRIGGSSDQPASPVPSPTADPCRGLGDYSPDNYADYSDQFLAEWKKAGYKIWSCVSAGEYFDVLDKAEAKGEAAEEAAYDRKVAKAYTKIAETAEKADAVTMGAKLNLALIYAHKHRNDNRSDVARDAAKRYYADNFKSDPEMGWTKEFADMYDLRYPDEERMPSAPQNWNKSSSLPTTKPYPSAPPTAG